METQSVLYVKKRTLLAIAGIVWLIAGFNVARMGVLAYLTLGELGLLPLVSVATFGAFGTMFYQMTKKHSTRISAMDDKRVGFWHFFDGKSYVIMAFMMSMGIYLRASGLVPSAFIASFYTGLGCALALAGVLFCVAYMRAQN